MRFGSPLSKDLRQKHGRKAVRPRVNDTVRITRGEFKGIEGKVTAVFASKGKLAVEGVTRDKTAGGTAAIPVDSSKVVITALVMDDKKRKAKLEERE